MTNQTALHKTVYYTQQQQVIVSKHFKDTSHTDLIVLYRQGHGIQDVTCETLHGFAIRPMMSAASAQ